MKLNVVGPVIKLRPGNVLFPNRPLCVSGGSRILKRGNFLRGADFFMGGAGEGRILRSYYQSRSDCTRPQAVMRVDAGGGSPLPLIGGPGEIFNL